MSSTAAAALKILEVELVRELVRLCCWCELSWAGTLEVSAASQEVVVSMGGWMDASVLRLSRLASFEGVGGGSPPEELNLVVLGLPVGGWEALFLESWRSFDTFGSLREDKERPDGV